ncbi:DUF6684 family protein [Halococcoides cellulosivorans]|uniref:Cox cluster protein n=1 Tax=Halococcoides cellulosivorans TaxID=1679096 RepID=A0A2R4X120_9EURY|nr:DUF6684 family protein [Halococcoides cellulosivorans]AWB27471.1 hypothetical protein HARCEL1_07005 [Halococcoides cellulosivorans]
MSRTFDKQVVLDITVNLVPMAVLLGFVAMIALLDPWSDLGLVPGIQQYLLILIPLLALAWITKVAVEAIERSGGEVEPAGVGLDERDPPRRSPDETEK